MSDGEEEFMIVDDDEVPKDKKFDNSIPLPTLSKKSNTPTPQDEKEKDDSNAPWYLFYLLNFT